MAKIIVKTGFLGSKKLVKERNNICDNCELKQMRFGQGFCLECGCVLPIKTRAANQECPIGKW